MTELMEQALAALGHWPASRQDDAAHMLLALDRLGQSYDASDDELAAIDEALAQAGRGEYATAAEVEAAFARFRK
jgi:predicted transcriptional regulator